MYIERTFSFVFFLFAKKQHVSVVLKNNLAFAF